MLLVIDIGNTNIVVGVFNQNHLIHSWRIRTERNTTEDEFFLLISNFLSLHGLSVQNISKTIVSCVVPPLMGMIEFFCQKHLKQEPNFVNPRSSSMPILYKNPSEVGADRIVNAVAAYRKYQTAMIVIDFGTATTFDCISKDGAYLGGAICPGIMISAEALFYHASKLPRVDLFNPPEHVIGKDTSESIRSGILYGYASLVDGIVERISKEMNTKPIIIATGGLARIIAKVSNTIQHVEEMLTLEGLRILSMENDTDRMNA